MFDVEKEVKMKKYRVYISYIHEFIVEASNEEEAIQKAHSEGDGKIIGYENETVEEIEDE